MIQGSNVVPEIQFSPLYFLVPYLQCRFHSVASSGHQATANSSQDSVLPASSAVGDRRPWYHTSSQNLIACGQASVGSRLTSVQTLSWGGVRSLRSTRTEGQGRRDFMEEGRMDSVSREANVPWRLLSLPSERLPGGQESQFLLCDFPQG